MLFLDYPLVTLIFPQWASSLKNIMMKQSNPYQIGNYLGVSKKDQWLISGKIRTEVLRLANRLGSNFILASAQQIQELQRSLFFKNIHQYAIIKNINQLKQL